MSYSKIGPFTNGAAPPIDKAFLDGVENYLVRTPDGNDAGGSGKFAVWNGSSWTYTSAISASSVSAYPADATKVLAGDGSWPQVLTGGKLDPAKLNNYPTDATKVLAGDGSWKVAAGVDSAKTVSAANTDLAAPTGIVDYMTITTGGGTLRSIGAPPATGSILTLKNATASSYVRLLHATAGGSGAQLSIVNAGSKYLAPGQSIQLVYDGTNWAEINRPAREIICDLTLSGAQATFDTDTILGIASSLPQVYSHLEIVLTARSSIVASADTASARFNNDSAGNYDQELLTGDSATAAASVGSAQTSAALGLINAANNTANYVSQMVSAIAGYRDTTFFKNCVTTAYGPYFVTSARTMIYASNWRSTSAITRITLLCGANFIAGSRFSLYGIT